MLKLAQTDRQTDRQTNQPTNRQGKNNMSPTTIINILTKCHKDWMKTVTSIVYTSDLINNLTKFHEDWMKTMDIVTHFHEDQEENMTSRELTKMKVLTNFHEDWYEK
ncbi:hypothetical protein DPMN_021563 [Dreissena polymorpha]|uniref:Uncharacterized protein n=1 Tax=Dreissena polymorpha TaxID=45954 RepID=A0A9D4SB63_DREPO|nr:hypothetical protein DPMN_021563 [Dreissena polymorpha]